MNPPSFFALYTGRTDDSDADLMVIFANRDERTALDVHDTRTNLEAEGETVVVQPFDRLADIPDVLTPSVPSDRPEVRHTQAEATQALKALEHFIGPLQLRVLRDCCRGEEKQYFFDLLCEYAERVATMPQTYDQDGKDKDAIAYLHYFAGGACNWYITEKDKGSPDDEVPGTQLQAFGWADLGDAMNAELGYISIAEIISNGGELDLHFTPKPLKECIEPQPV